MAKKELFRCRFFEVCVEQESFDCPEAKADKPEGYCSRRIYVGKNPPIDDTPSAFEDEYPDDREMYG
jgi:hypothetical protein